MSTNLRPAVQHIRSSVKGNIPTATKLEDGEIALNIAEGGESLFIKNAAGKIKSMPFVSTDTVTSLQSIPTDSTITVVNVTAGGTLSLNGTLAEGREKLIIIINGNTDDGNSIVVNIPSTLENGTVCYHNGKKAEVSVNISADNCVEISLLKVGGIIFSQYSN